jgi:tetratricopeptide (TPR) repeat protein
MRMKIVRNGLANRSRWSKICAAVVIALAAPSGARAGSITIGSSSGPSPAMAVEVDTLARSIVEVKQAVTSFQKRDFENCLQQLATAVKAHPELPPAHALLAKLALLSNETALARPALENAVAQAPDHPEIYILFGNLAIFENRATDALLHFEKAKALAAAESWTADQRKRFERCCHQGFAVVAESRGDWKATRSALEAWLALEPTNAHARQGLGKALFHLKAYDPAYKELQAAVKDDATLEPSEVTMGWLFAAAGYLKKAEEWMDYAVKIAPDSQAVRIGMASWLLERGRGDEAQSHLDAAAKLGPESAGLSRLAGLAARQRKDLAQAEQVFQAMADEAPADTWVRNQLALVLAEQKDPAKQKRALELAELSVRQTPKAADAIATLGTVYFRLNRLDDAEKLLAAVVQNGRCQSDDVLALARVAAARGKKDAVVSLLKKALAASGLFLERNEAQRWLEDLEKAKL